MKTLHLLIATLAISFLDSSAAAQTVRFYASPSSVKAGATVRFFFLEKDGSLPLAQVKEWRWDFNGDGTFDKTGTDIREISQTWIAAFDPNAAVDGIFTVTPVLEVVDQAGNTNRQVGITENTRGTTDVDPTIVVSDGVGGNEDLTVAISANRRLATVNYSIRFFAPVTFKNGKTGRILGVDWNFDSSLGLKETSFPFANVSSPSYAYSVAGDYSVAVRVRYALKDPQTGQYNTTNQLVQAAGQLVRIVNVTDKISVGRAYRRDFPSLYGWDDIFEKYTAPDTVGGTHTYFRLFEEAYNELVPPLLLNGFSVNSITAADQRRQLAELANEILQGQNLVGNRRLTEALMVKYPRIANPDAPEERLPVPPDVPEEVAAIELAALEYQAGVYHVFNLVHGLGLDFFRSRATPGSEPYPNHPDYVTFSDPTLSGTPVPIKNEFAQLGTAISAIAQARSEKARKLWRKSVSDETARTEGKTEAKKAGIHGYLGMALLAARQSPEDYELNKGGQVLSHIQNAQEIFQNINNGVSPIVKDGSYIPNESFAAIYQDAQEAVADARESEINVRNDKREYDNTQAALRTEVLTQRKDFLVPLKSLTGLDPANYNDLQTVPDQMDFRNTVVNRIQSVLQDYPNTGVSGLGTLGISILGVLNAAKEVELRIDAVEDLKNSIEISKWANTKINQRIGQDTKELYATHILLGIAKAVQSDTGNTSVFGLFKVGSGASAVEGAAIGALEARLEQIRDLQRIAINNIQIEAEIRNRLLGENNLVIQVEQAKIDLSKANAILEGDANKMDEFIQELAHTRSTAEDLYFTDPSFRIILSSAQKRATKELDFAIDRLYRLARTLEYEWAEDYHNPVVIPTSSYEDPALESQLFTKFSTRDDLFGVRTADEAKDYLDALKAWDSKLRRVNVVSVRGPNNSGPHTARPISVREQVWFFDPNFPGVTMEQSIRQFREKVQASRVANPLNPENPALEFAFSTSVDDNFMFPSAALEWNMRLHSVRVDLVADAGFNRDQVIELDLTLGGMATLGRFFTNDLPAKLSFNSQDRTRSAFTIKVPARINGATGGLPPAEFENLNLKGRPIAATTWILRIDTSKPYNRNVDFTKLKDIILRFTYTYGNPPEFPNF